MWRVDGPNSCDASHRLRDSGEGHWNALGGPQMKLSSFQPTSCHGRPVVVRSMGLCLLVERREPLGAEAEVTRDLRPARLTRDRLGPAQVDEAVHPRLLDQPRGAPSQSLPTSGEGSGGVNGAIDAW